MSSFILLLSVYRKPVPASFVTHFCIQKGHLQKSASVPTIFLSSGYSQSASLLSHNRITAPQFIRMSLHSSWYKQVPTHCLLLFAIEAGDLLDSVKIIHLYSIKVIEISSVLTSFPYIMMIWKQWQPADMVKLSDFSPFWLCVPAFQQVCL